MTRPYKRRRVTDEKLKILIDGLTYYREQGVVDPWVLNDGRVIEPLDILNELWDWRHPTVPAVKP